MTDIVDRLSKALAEVARYKEQAAKGTEYVLAQINEDLRVELTEMTKQRDHHASTIFINSVQIGNLREAVARKTSDRALAEKEVDELRAEVARLTQERDALQAALRQIRDETADHDSESYEVAAAALPKPEEHKP